MKITQLHVVNFKNEENKGNLDCKETNTHKKYLLGITKLIKKTPFTFIMFMGY